MLNRSAIPKQPLHSHAVPSHLSEARVAQQTSQMEMMSGRGVTKAQCSSKPEEEGKTVSFYIHEFDITQENYLGTLYFSKY